MIKMKIAIITLPFHVNYGGYLQAYALQYVLNGLGNKTSVVVFDKYPKWRVWMSYLKWKLLQKKRILYGVEDSFKDFLMLKINKAYYKSFNEIQKRDFDGYVVGSDQVWRKKFVKNLTYAFLGFTKDWNVKRIAYAPSFGITEWDYTQDETLMCRGLLSKFDKVSVREKSGEELCEEHLGVKPFIALDPTLIAPKSAYVQLLDKKIEKGGTFIYFVKKNEAKVDVMDVLNALKISKYKEVKLPCKGYITGKLPTVSAWLSYIVNADVVLTDSFHACVFCLIFHKPFLVMPCGWGGKSRFESLLSPLGLDYRVIIDMSQDLSALLYRKVEWKEIDKKMAEKRNASLKFLSEAIAH